MDLSITFLLLVHGINTILNWSVLLLVQRSYVANSFMGIFCISLTLMDTLHTAVELALYVLQDFSLFGVRFTTHHICVLVHVVGLVYSTLQWPVLFAAALDNCGSVPVGPKQTLKSPKLSYTACAGALWVFALLYTASLLSGIEKPAVHPAREDSPTLLLDHCQTPRDSTSSQVSMALLLTVGFYMLYSWLVTGKDMFREETRKHSLQTSQKCGPSRIHILAQSFNTFIGTWAAFLILVAAILAFRIDVPPHLMLNVPWLAFLNSFLISLSLCIHYQKLKINKITTVSDGFCQWNFVLNV